MIYFKKRLSRHWFLGVNTKRKWPLFEYWRGINACTEMRGYNYRFYKWQFTYVTNEILEDIGDSRK